MITWNGITSDSIGVIVERMPNRYVPARRISPKSVPGRNGDILSIDRSFPNVEQEYEVYLSAESVGLPSVARACAEWLMSPAGYAELKDSYDNSVFREAVLVNGFDIENILNQFGRCTITFYCKPQKFLYTGLPSITIDPTGDKQTYTGDIVTFDAVDGDSITSLSVPFSPIQDLHGYSHPWPAGGGKNLFGETLRNGYMPLSLPVGTFTATAERIDTATTAYFYIARAVSGTTDYETIGRVLAGRNENPVTFTVEAGYDYYAWCNATYTNVQHVQIEQGSTATDWTPYENICHVSGRTGLSVYVSPTTAQADATTYAVDWTDEAGTVYGGTDEVVGGVLTDEWAEIPSYNGETITEPWLSSMDEYTPGATPTTGAQVVYKLATPLTYQLSPQEVETLVGENNIWADTGEDITVEVTGPVRLTNPTPFDALPLLTVSGEGAITINDRTILIQEAVEDFEIDCESGEADDNSKIYCMEFPVLHGGQNLISCDSTITSLSLIPRWWTL